MSLPIAKIIWYKTDPGPHGNHLHVEGDPRFAQWEMPTNGIWTPAINAIVDALDDRYGEGEHFIIDPDAPWTHMGVYNPRYISGTTIWSQHAGANAIDIGPYYDEEQQEFYDFLTGKEEYMNKEEILRELGISKWDLLTLQQINQGYTDARVDRNIISKSIEHLVDLYRNRGNSSGGGLSKAEVISLIESANIEVE